MINLLHKVDNQFHESIYLIKSTLSAMPVMILITMICLFRELGFGYPLVVTPLPISEKGQESLSRRWHSGNHPHLADILRGGGNLSDFSKTLDL